MTVEKRYLVASRTGATLTTEPSKQHLRGLVQTDLQGKVVREAKASGRHVVQISEQGARVLAHQRPDLIVEEDKPLQLARMPGLPTIMEQAAGTELPLKVSNDRGQPVADCSIYAVAQGIGYRANTDEQGNARVVVGTADIDRIIVSPRDSYWSVIFNQIDTDNFTELSVKLQAFSPVETTAWWHRLMGFDQVAQALTGSGISVAVIDSGIAATAKSLYPVGGINTLDGADPVTWNVDEKGHGTHCGGIIAAQTDAAGASIQGCAPGTSLYSVKVFPGGYVSDLVEGIEWCMANGIELINMSLGNPEPSAILAAAIDSAYAQGITVVAATGNEGSHVAFPAAHPRVIGVGAIGRANSFPDNSAHALRVGRYTDWWGGLFNASFSNFGAGVHVCGPGVAIASTVPTGYAAWDGTSMACPCITAMLALVLEACPHLRTGDFRQPEALRWILANAAVDMGLPPAIQGHGLPTMPRVLASAQQLG